MREEENSMPMSYVVPENFAPLLGQVRKLLGPFLTEGRLGRFDAVAEGRSRRIVGVFEDTHHSHNISAVLRTMDALGFQDVLFVYSEERSKARCRDNVERGSSNWLSIRRAPTIAACAQVLRASGYKLLLVTLPSFEDSAGSYRRDLPSFPVHSFSSDSFDSFVGDAPLALVFGNEAEGVSAEWAAFADGYVHVAMTGFAESLNLSVCAGMMFQALRSSLVLGQERSLLLPHERALIQEQWCIRSWANGFDTLIKRSALPNQYIEFIIQGRFFWPFRQCG